MITLQRYPQKFKLFTYSFAICLICYGYALANFTVTIDGENPIYPDFAMSLGRWGLNFIRYKLLGGYTPYFTLLAALAFMSLAAVEICRTLKLRGINAYLFCSLFLTFPQLAYQLVFLVQAEAVGLAFLLNVYSYSLFLLAYDQKNKYTKLGLFTLSALLITFALSIYQALIFIPIVLCLTQMLINSNLSSFSFKYELKKNIIFAIVLAIGSGLYFLSVDLLCPPIQGSYLSSYVAGESENKLVAFYKLWIELIKGKMFYGNTLFLISTLLFSVLILKYALDKKMFFLKFGIIAILLIMPFTLSYFITNGYHPPRLYMSMGIVFAVPFILLMNRLKTSNIPIAVTFVISFINIYYVTELYNSQNKIVGQDVNNAKTILLKINTKYPEIDLNKTPVYFHGSITGEFYDKFALPQSEIFSGSFLKWDNGNNYRIQNFYSYMGIANLQITNQAGYAKIKERIATLPVWPNSNSIELIDGIMVVKLGPNEGSPLPN
ncbi:MAG: hypothetical protein DCE86_04680 [Flavobacteriaceae bacterium]|uniref:glucosyltransferase domain-containing protein n=1 Tax=Flavobacterium sp. Leaf359 TaxID=1736351 RepID=UPI0006F48E21|nr:glucosyltransferase domain-containing protein [Flavobacterium sp. Leaf359]KQS52732.1 hypothetical protein ASG38_16515 [Flavobacterium sp. Leaf359]PZO33451.1 MAG: hypothetical protein DCE86_04680 [Flavobacteriaceae bacterium]